jgi:hypothetical protein
MARATGTDLATAMQDGELSTDDWAQMVTNCRGCSCVQACRDKLATLERTGTLTDAPDYCENRASFDRLARQPA